MQNLSTPGAGQALWVHLLHPLPSRATSTGCPGPFQVASDDLQGVGSTTSPGSLFQCLIPLPKKIFLISNLSLPVVQLKAITSCPIASYLVKKADLHFTTTSFQVVVESNRVPPETPLL